MLVIVVILRDYVSCTPGGKVQVCYYRSLPGGIPSLTISSFLALHPSFDTKSPLVGHILLQLVIPSVHTTLISFVLRTIHNDPRHDHPLHQRHRCHLFDLITRHSHTSNPHNHHRQHHRHNPCPLPHLDIPLPHHEQQQFQLRNEHRYHILHHVCRHEPSPFNTFFLVPYQAPLTNNAPLPPRPPRPPPPPRSHLVQSRRHSRQQDRLKDQDQETAKCCVDCADGAARCSAGFAPTWL